jgi:geranylgeranyl diphosphate synthase type II
MHTAAQLHELYETKYTLSTFPHHPRGLYDPVKHIMSIKGKRIRPILALMACEMFGGEAEDALDAAFAVEVFHNFTLVHDDIMDAADLRRGAPTVHKVYGLNKAILGGDVMFSYAYKHMLRLPLEHQYAVMQTFNKAAIEIFEGQQMDMDFETRLDVEVDEYMQMIEFKTSVLLAAALKMGAILGGANEEQQEHIYQFGLKLGLSFQIKDDYLDAFGGEKVGKTVGGDIIQNKKTFLLIHALNKTAGADKERLLQLLEEKDAAVKVPAVKALFESSGVKAYTLEHISKLYHDSLAHLEMVDVPDEQKSMLHELAKSIHEREF